MREDELAILQEYDIDVRNTRKVRGAILCDSAQGLYLIKEMKFSEKRMAALCGLHDRLQEQGYSYIDWILKNKEGAPFSGGEDGSKYFLTRWYNGRECDIHKESDVMEAVRTLTAIHKALRECETLEIPVGENTEQEFFRHNREMKKVRTFMRDKVGKGDFELTFLKYFDAMYASAQTALERLQKSDYDMLFERAKKQHTMIHGDYNYHNILMMCGSVATTNFEHAQINLQVTDLYYFLRKVMEKNRWDVQLGDKIIRNYHKLLPLEDAELEYLAICIAYPEKFWKAANSYYRSRKVWIPAKNLEKLEMVIRQAEEKKAFLKTIFSFQL